MQEGKDELRYVEVVRTSCELANCPVLVDKEGVVRSKICRKVKTSSGI
jgi:hypothetical protein